MQRFGLYRNSASKHAALETEIAREQASSLGRSGKKLSVSLANYQDKLSQNLSSEQKNALLNEVANNVWELVLQREFIGFIEGNLNWVKENYSIPEEALNRLGQQR